MEVGVFCCVKLSPFYNFFHSIDMIVKLSQIIVVTTHRREVCDFTFKRRATFEASLKIGQAFDGCERINRFAPAIENKASRALAGRDVSFRPQAG